MIDHTTVLARKTPDNSEREANATPESFRDELLTLAIEANAKNV